MDETVRQAVNRNAADEEDVDASCLYPPGRLNDKAPLPAKRGSGNRRDDEGVRAAGRGQGELCSRDTGCGVARGGDHSKMASRNQHAEAESSTRASTFSECKANKSSE